MCGFKLEKLKLFVFVGNVWDYVIFCLDFKYVIEVKYLKRDLIMFLCMCLWDKLFEFIKGIGSDYDVVWEYFDFIYGDLRFVLDIVI